MRGPEKPGDHEDPVAQNIRREQNQAAAPSPEEMEKMKRESLRENGCTRCGEDDPDSLQYIQLPEPDIAQAPPEPFVVVCDECRDTVIEAAKQKAKRADKKCRERRDNRR